MKRTLPAFVVALALSTIIYPLFADRTSVLIFGNSAQIVGLCYALYHFLKLASVTGQKDPLRVAWLRCAFGILIWLIAQLLEFYCEMVLKLIAYGTIADTFWVIGYFPLMMGFHRILKQFVKVDAKWTVLIFGAAYVLLVVFLILPQYEQPQRWSEVVLDFSYPTFDWILLVQAFLIMRSAQTRAERLFGLFAQAAFLLTLVGDGILSLIQNFATLTYRSIDIYYFSCYFMLALAAEHRSKKKVSTEVTERI